MNRNLKTIIKNQALSLRYLVLLSLFIATFLIYTPGLNGKFILDDHTTVVNNKIIQLGSLNFSELYQAALSSNSGPLKRPISMLSLSIDHYFHGANPYYFKQTNLFIHLLNGLLVFLLTHLLIGAYTKSKNINVENGRLYWISFFTTAAWLLHPLNLTSVLYVSQRMNSLSALFTFAGLAFYIYGRSKTTTQRGAILTIASVFLIFWPLASLSKENGALLPLFLLIIEATIFRFKTTKKIGQNSLKLTYALTVGLPAITILSFILINPDWITRGYITRDFSFTERILTECRVLWFYIGLIIFPRNSALGIYHDDFQISAGLLDPVTTIISIIGLVTLIFAAIWFHKKIPLISFGILFFIAGHSMESSIFSLELIYEHRNYVPIYGILVTVFYFLLSPEHKQKRYNALKYISAFVVLLFAVITVERAHYWGHPFLHHFMEVTNHPDSARANHEIAIKYAELLPIQKYNVKGNYKAAREHFEAATNANENYTASLFGLITLNYSVNKAPEPDWLTDLKTRLINSPISSSTIDGLTNLTNCDAQTPCVLEEKTILELFNATLGNKTLTGHNRAIILSALASFYANRLNDLENALVFARKAINNTPNNANYRLNHALLLIALNRQTDAKNELLEARSLDTLGRYSDRILDLEKMIQPD